MPEDDGHAGVSATGNVGDEQQTRLTDEEFRKIAQPAIRKNANKLYFCGAKHARFWLQVYQWRGRTIDCRLGNDTDFDISGTVLAEMLGGEPSNRRWNPHVMTLTEFHRETIRKEVRNRADRMENTTRIALPTHNKQGDELSEEEAREWVRIVAHEVERIEAECSDPSLYPQEYAVEKEQLIDMVIRALPPGYDLSGEILIWSVCHGVATTDGLAELTRRTEKEIRKERKRLARLMKDSPLFKARLETLWKATRTAPQGVTEAQVRRRPPFPVRARDVEQLDNNRANPTAADDGSEQ